MPVGENIDKPVIKVRHTELERVTDERHYRSWCPICKKGIFLVARFGFSDPRLSRLDHCSYCGQHIWYVDESIGGEKLYDPPVTPFVKSPNVAELIRIPDEYQQKLGLGPYEPKPNPAPIPGTLEECFPLLENGLSEENRRELREATDPDAVAVSWHRDIGRQIRNRWGLWEKSVLFEHMKTRFGLEHADDMSHRILVEFARSHIPTAWDRLVKDE